jgi:hypothetical protein
MVSTSRLLSESSGPLARTAVRAIVLEVEHGLTNLARLIDALP